MSKIDLDALTKTMTDTLEKVVDGVKDVISTHAQIDVNAEQKSLLDQIDELANLHADATKKLAALKKSLIKEISKADGGKKPAAKPEKAEKAEKKD